MVYSKWLDGGWEADNDISGVSGINGVRSEPVFIVDLYAQVPAIVDL
jgi:hypothetical protein